MVHECVKLYKKTFEYFIRLLNICVLFLYFNINLIFNFIFMLTIYLLYCTINNLITFCSIYIYIYMLPFKCLWSVRFFYLRN